MGSCTYAVQFAQTSAASRSESRYRARPDVSCTWRDARAGWDDLYGRNSGGEDFRPDQPHRGIADLSTTSRGSNGSCGAHTIGDICISDPGLRIGKTKGAARSGLAKRTGVTEGRRRAGLSEAKRELNLTFHALVI